MNIPGTIMTVNLVDGRYVERTTFLVCSVSCEPDRLTVNLVDGKAGENDTYDRSKEFRRIRPIASNRYVLITRVASCRNKK